MSTEDLSLDDYIAKRRISVNRPDQRGRRRSGGYYNNNNRSRSPAFWEHDLYDEDGRRPRSSMAGNRRPSFRSRSRSPVSRPRSRYGKRFDRENRTLDRSGCKIIIDNLDYGVTDDDMEELFREFGDIKRVSVLFNSKGKSTGSAEIVFRRPEFANDAQVQYDGVLLDGRPMHITVVRDHNSRYSSRDRSRSPQYYGRRPSSRQTQESRFRY